MAETQVAPAAAPGGAATAGAEPEAGRGLLDEIVARGRLGRDADARRRGRDLVREFVAEVLSGAITVSTHTEAAINARIAELDAAVSAQLNEIMHAPQMQRLESTWRGMKYLLAQTETGDMLKLRVLNVTKKELLRDFRNASEFDQSALWKKVYEGEYGTFGGDPYGALVGDYEFGRSVEDVELLEGMSKVAAAAHSPFITGTSPEMLNLDSFTDLPKPREVARIFDPADYVKWKAFRDSDESRYVALTLPRVLLRLPYGKDTIPVEAFQYEEGVDGVDHSRYLWGNAAWALAARVTNAFSLYGWCATIRGVESGGLVEGLPVHTFRTDDGDVAMKCPREVQIAVRRERELAELGFVALVHRKGSDRAAFFAVQSAQKPKNYQGDAATANARISAQLPYIFAVSRFAHYLKVIVRDKIGGFTSREDVERFLNNWINHYTIDGDGAGFELKARHPLKQARVEVVEVPRKPGAYHAVAFLRPHFQLDELTIAMRLVAELPPPAK
jgi:type VI secretion system protein ImpC